MPEFLLSFKALSPLLSAALSLTLGSPLFSAPAGVFSQAASAVSAMSTAMSTASTDKILRFIWSTLLCNFVVGKSAGGAVLLHGVCIMIYFLY